MPQCFSRSPPWAQQALVHSRSAGRAPGAGNQRGSSSTWGSGALSGGGYGVFLLLRHV